MTGRQELYFELYDSGDFVRLEPIDLINYNSEFDWDRNFIKTRVTIKGGKFSGQYNGEFMTVDFENFKQELSKLYDNLNGIANFYDIEGYGYLDLKIIGDSLGHFEVKVLARDRSGINPCELTFKMSFDQTQIKELVNQLDLITKEYPIIGDFKIKNE